MLLDFSFHFKKAYAEAKAGKAADNTVKASEAAAKAVKKTGEETSKAVQFVARHKKGFVILGVIGMMFLFVSAVMSSCSVMMSSLTSSGVLTTYPNADADMLAAEAQYLALEAELQEYLDNYESTHDYDEYHFDLDEIEHDPYVLISMLTALREGEWTIDEVGDLLQTIVVVLTQSFSKKKAQEMRQMLLDENLDVIQVIPVLAEDYEIEDLGTAKAYGLDVLIKVMGEALPEELMETLQHVQIACLEEKKRRAQAAVATAAVAAAGEGATPIPFSDCALLIPTQVGMIASITVIFGFEVNKSIITALLSSTIGAGGATLLGKTVVTNLLKLIPGAGTIAGGAISAGTAGVITAALGEAYIGIMELVFKGEMSIDEIGTKKGKEAMTALFKQNLSRKK